MKRRMILKSSILGFMVALVFVLFGCASSTTKEIFRLEVPSLELTVGDEITLGVVPGSVGKNEKVRYYVQVEGLFDVLDEEGNVVKDETGNVKQEKRWETTKEYTEIISSSEDDLGNIALGNEKISMKALKAGVLRLTVERVENVTVTHTIDLVITEKVINGITEVKVSTPSINVGGSGTVTKVSVYPEDIACTFTYESSDTEILTVDSTGKFTGVKAGKANVKVICNENPSVVALVEITVK